MEDLFDDYSSSSDSMDESDDESLNEYREPLDSVPFEADEDIQHNNREITTMSYISADSFLRFLYEATFDVEKAVLVKDLEKKSSTYPIEVFIEDIFSVVLSICSESPKTTSRRMMRVDDCPAKLEELSSWGRARFKPRVKRVKRAKKQTSGDKERQISPGHRLRMERLQEKSTVISSSPSLFSQSLMIHPQVKRSFPTFQATLLEPIASSEGIEVPMKTRTQVEEAGFVSRFSYDLALVASSDQDGLEGPSRENDIKVEPKTDSEPKTDTAGKASEMEIKPIHAIHKKNKPRVLSPLVRAE